MLANPKVDFYFKKAVKWQKEVALLREIILECELVEQPKWGQPCYTFEDANIVLIHDFNEYCALLFFKGVLMKDPKKLLIQQTKNVQSARHLRFTNLKEIQKLKATIQKYVYEAVEIEVKGLKVTLKKTSEFEMVDEFKKKLDATPAFKKAFYELTPGRQRGYLLFFASAKQSKTRDERIEKYRKHIMSGKGLNDE